MLYNIGVHKYAQQSRSYTLIEKKRRIKMEKEKITNENELNEPITIVDIIEQLQNKIDLLETRVDKLLVMFYSEIAS